ncbi:hypothetical protein FEM33_15400 [Dyadobacter flavalbus]|uniref:Uncharacterized protein n=1 Tax=Dyadobacter flavalbus TaxID=2579942 RepID=A0A5M8QW41_9BACT|nr:hypothetical protein [Dyadobacter flavalbus]KAA6438856.1 hypothetical protein FEM33_15400 [Dyadobacter flavalbus]
MSKLQIEELSGKLVVVINYQTTYVIVKVDGNEMRINFDHKQEFKLVKGKSGQLQYLDEHPLLMNYNEQSISMYINSKPENAAKLNSEIQLAVDELLKGWRNWDSYFLDVHSRSSIETFKSNLLSGSGRIFEGPITIANRVIAVFEKHNVLTKSFPGLLKQKQYRLLLIENNYVIANAFEIVYK